MKFPPYITQDENLQKAIKELLHYVRTTYSLYDFMVMKNLLILGIFSTMFEGYISFKEYLRLIQFWIYTDHQKPRDLYYISQYPQRTIFCVKGETILNSTPYQMYYIAINKQGKLKQEFYRYKHFFPNLYNLKL